ncbi:MAG: hypothetical protein EU529_03430 [Promethearchaeota archaeon]|nr:MAG: hypothetical protein EU529_03430 [Candidatus Lokiarchaeota archaeon]
MTDKDMPVLELKPCSRCGNPFLVSKDEDLKKIVCENCIKLEQRKRELQLGVFDNVIEVENKMEASINEMKNTLTLSKGTFNKQFYMNKIKKRAEALWRSIELIEKIEETKEEKYIDEYKEMFEQLKTDFND